MTALLAEAAVRGGAGALPLFARRRAGLERTSLAFFLGFGFTGMAFFALALTRLFYPVVLAVCFLLPVLASRTVSSPRVHLLEGAGALKKLSRTGKSFLALAGAFVFFAVMPRLLLPDVDPDTYTYHLGAPWQYLLTHGAQLDNVTWAFHFPMPVEMLHALPLILGDERLARWMIFAAFASASLFFAGYCLRGKSKEAAWLGPLLAICTLQFLPLATGCKSDVAAAALFVVACMLSLQHSWIMSALFSGACVAAKPVLGPLVAAWWLFRPCPGRMAVPALAAGLLPLSPWMLKALLVTGNPLGLAAPWIDTFDWGWANRETWGTYSNLRGATTEWAKLPAAWLRETFRANLFAPLLAGGLLYWRRRRAAALACLAGQLATLKLASEPRFIMASIWLLALLGSVEVVRVPTKFRKSGVLLAGAAALAYLLGRYPVGEAGWRHLGSTAREYMESRLTTFEEALGILKEMKPKRILTAGEFATYRIPGRVLLGGTLGETPLIWKMVRESADAPRLAVKFRQLGADAVLHNYITAELVALHYADFEWDRRMIRLYADYLKSHQTRYRCTGGSDELNGGFCAYRVGRAPLKKPQEYLWTLPGADSVFKDVKLLEQKRDFRGALAAGRELAKILPDVGMVRAVVNRVYSQCP